MALSLGLDVRYRQSHRARLRVALLASSALIAAPAAAQDATWVAAGPVADWNINTNWTPAAVPSGTATFNGAGSAGIVFTNAVTTVQTLTFTPGIQVYTFDICACQEFRITGAGVINSSAPAPVFAVDGGLLSFRNGSTAGNATIANVGGSVDFRQSSSAGTANITNRAGGVTTFGNESSAADAIITNRAFSATDFRRRSNAGHADITNNGGVTQFFDDADAALATITNRNGGGTLFFDMSKAGTASITNRDFSGTSFENRSSADHADITNNGGITLFFNQATAGSATITNRNGGATIFNNRTTAADATIITRTGSFVQFFDRSTGGNARFITDAGGFVDFSETRGLGNDGRISAGSIEGGGTYFIGAGNVLSVGGNNLSTEVSGVIADFNPCGCATPGPGALTKVGTGTLILSGVNTYTGPTTVNDGMLAIAPTGSITSEVTNNAFFLNGGTVTGNLFNTGTTANTGVIVGAATINGGFVGNDGTITGLVTVNAGGTLGGNGNVGGAIVNGGGNLSPGNSIGTIQINGNLNFVGPGNYLVEVSPTAADRVNVTGAAALGGTLHAFATGTGYKIGTTYTVIHATGGVTGTFGNLDIVGHFGAAKPHIEYDGTNVFLVLGANAISPSLVGGTPNQKAVAGAVDAALLAGNQLAPFDALFNIATGLPGALDQLSGEVHASTLGVLLDESLYVRSAVLGRLRQASYGGDPDMAALSTGGPQLALMDDALTTLLAYGGRSLPVKAPLTAPAPSRDVAFWTQGFGAWGKFNGDGNAVGVRRDLAGFFTGVDARFGNWRGGIAAGYTASRNNLDGRGSANVESGHLAAYGGWSFGALRLRGGGAYAWHTIDTDRTIALPGFFDRANGHYDGGTGQIFGEAGYGFAFGRVAVEPFAGAAWVHLSADASTERGGAAALRVAANSFEVGYATLGIRAASMIPLWSDMILVPRVSAAWQHAFNDVTPAATLAFQGAGVPFVIAGVPIARDSLLGEAGLDLAIGRHAMLGVSYTGQLARNVHDHAAKGKFSWRF